MQSSDTATGVRVNCLYHVFSQKWNDKNKQALLFNFGEDLSYFMILQYILRDLIKIYNDFVNDPIKAVSEDFVTISDRQEKFGGIQIALAAYNT